MFTWIESASGYAHAVIRIAAGALFWCHGAQKFGLLGGLGGSGAAATAFTLLWWAGVIEFIAGPLLALGAATRIVALVAGGEMIVAFLYGHVPRGWLPLTNGGEAALLYALLYLLFLTRGPGLWSVDRAVARHRGAGPS